MDIAILSFGYGLLEDEDERLYESYGNDLREEDRDGDWVVSAEGDYVSGDSGVALGLCREFRELGHDAVATHYENVEAASEAADLVLSLGPFATLEEYQTFGDADSMYWWWCGKPTEDYGTAEEYVEQELEGSNFDAVLTNGEPAHSVLEGRFPTERIQIGYDSEKLWNCDDPPDYDPDVAYVGCGALKDEEHMERIFEPATEYDLEIYGMLWDETPYSEYHEGLLPRGHMGELYSNASVVLGLQGDEIGWGMMNDRVFQALGSDAVFVDRHHPNLADQPVAEYLEMVESKAEMRELLADIFENEQEHRERAERGGEYVRNNHTYAHTVERVLDFYTEAF